eukprot:jgi/Mesen1/5263/ME000263S04370
MPPATASSPAPPAPPPARFSIVDLPPALIQEVFGGLDARCLSVVSCVCHLFRRLAADSYGWRQSYCERWEPPPASASALRKGGGGGGRGGSGGGKGREEGSSPSAAAASRGADDDTASCHVPGARWKEMYLDREMRSRAMLGRFQKDLLYGHTAGVRCVRMLPSADLAVTAGYDSTVRIWDLARGLPVAQSAPLGECMRAVAVDDDTLVVAGSDAIVRVWPAAQGCPHRFDVAGLWPAAPPPSAAAASSTLATPAHVDAPFDSSDLASGGGGGGRRASGGSLVYGHGGPISCLQLDDRCLYSGSWDLTVRAWGRRWGGGAVGGSGGRRGIARTPLQTFFHADWVWALAARGPRLVTTAGADQYSWDVETGCLLRVRRGVHAGQAEAVECTRSRHLVFTGGEDGAVRMFDERLPPPTPSAARVAGAGPLDCGGMKEAVVTWHPHSAAVRHLALEDPWLISASADKACALMDIRKVAPRGDATWLGRGKGKAGGGGRAGAGVWGRQQPGKGGGGGERGHFETGVGFVEPVQRRLGGFEHGVYSVDLGGDRVVCAGEDSEVRVFDFKQALAVERAAQASRAARSRRKARQGQEGHASKAVVVTLCGTAGA